MVSEKSMNKGRLQQLQQSITGLNQPLAQDNPYTSRKYLKMAESPWHFFRGSAELFYADIINGPLQELSPNELKQQVTTTIVGDCHLSNFGFFTEESAHGDNVIFACNDFDDACVGFPSWDLTRFLISLHITSHTKDTNIKPSESATSIFLDSYVNTCKKVIRHPQYRNTCIGSHNTPPTFMGLFKKTKAQSSTGKNFLTKSSLAKAVDLKNRPLQFKSKAKLNTPDPHSYKGIEQACRLYLNDDIKDIAQRINAGTGSLDLQRYYLLVGPAHISNKKDLSLYYVVEMKQQRQPSALKHFSNIDPVNQQRSAELHTYCQRLMQRNPDIVLKNLQWKNKEWLLRSRHHARTNIKPNMMDCTEKFIDYAKMCGKALALAHSRGDRRSILFEKNMVNYLNKNKNQLIELSSSYSEQLFTDYKLFKQLIK
jgi:uncharacterized protein (DUF2252 family)